MIAMTMQKTIFNKYQSDLMTFPQPGAGCHPAIMGVANLGILAEIDAEQIFTDIRASIPSGGRRVPDREAVLDVPSTHALRGGGRSAQSDHTAQAHGTQPMSLSRCRRHILTLCLTDTPRMACAPCDSPGAPVV